MKKLLIQFIKFSHPNWIRAAYIDSKTNQDRNRIRLKSGSGEGVCFKASPQSDTWIFQPVPAITLAPENLHNDHIPTGQAENLQLTSILTLSMRDKHI